MLLELAIGDAYGAGFEYANGNVDLYNDLSAYVKHPRHNICAGCYTDDTQMTLAIVELILAQTEWTPLNIAEYFVTAFRRDPREGYASEFHKLLLSMKTGKNFLQYIRANSDKSGAAMRATPIGIFPTIPEVIEKTTLQASLTHNTPNGIQAAVASALTAHYFMYRLGAKKQLGEFLDSHVEGKKRWSESYEGKVKEKGWMSVHAAVTAIQRNETLSDLLQDCINFRGDVDTVATIALGAASHSTEIEPNLPDHLINGLENGQYGRDYIQTLDTQLLAQLEVYRAAKTSS